MSAIIATFRIKVPEAKPRETWPLAIAAAVIKYVPTGYPTVAPVVGNERENRRPLLTNRRRARECYAFNVTDIDDVDGGLSRVFAGVR